ncbi:MAG TPA: TolC family protein [Xanthomonadaceae bacterium]|nr:TolC family protein [Xanthomonadaceae bacterium]
MTTRWGAVALGCLLAGSASALSPEEAVRLALSRPENTVSMEAAVDLAHADLLEARAWPNPELRVGREDPRGADREPGETSVMLAQTLELGGRRGLTRATRELEVAAARARAEVARNELRADVLQGYYAVLAEERRVGALMAHGADLARLSRIAEKRRAAGDLSGYAQRRIAQLERSATSRLEIARGEAATQRAALQALIGQPVPPLGDVHPLAPPDPPPHQQLGESLERSALLRALSGQRDAAVAGERAARRPALPVTFGVGRKRFGGGPGGRTDDALLLELSVPLPVFERNRAGIARNTVLAADAEARYLRTRTEVAARIEAAWQQASGLTRAARTLREQDLPESAELVRIALLSFDAGELDLPGLIDALDARLAAHEQLLDTEWRARRASIELEQLTSGDMP